MKIQKIMTLFMKLNGYENAPRLINFQHYFGHSKPQYMFVISVETHFGTFRQKILI